MIHADLHGKTGVPEDVLTSCCLGLMRLLPDTHVLQAFSMACRYDGSKINLAEVDVISDIEFWPWLHHGGQPDAIVTAQASTAQRRLKIVIEVKHGAGKSGGEEDQLARYFRAARTQYPDHQITLIYLTHHRDMPASELDDTLKELKLPAEKSGIYWLSWYSIVEWSLRMQKAGGVAPTESRIFAALGSYLALKGYQRYEGWLSVGARPRLAPVYARCYSMGLGAAPWQVELPYSRSYGQPAIAPQISTIYEPSTKAN